jgi:serine/threonine protein kinase/class 3 adenylate cyclase
MNQDLVVIKLIHESERSKVTLVKNSQDGRLYVLKENKGPMDARIFNEEALTRESYAGIRTSTLNWEGKTAYIRPYFPGNSLQNILSEGPLPIDTFLSLAIEICQKLDEIHRHQIIHKDINPSNLIYDEENGEIHFIDFEYSTLLQTEEVTQVRANYIQGTLAYMAPEQTGRTGKRLDYRCDLYALGATFYELLTGKPPFRQEDPLELIHSHLAVMPSSPSRIRSEVPEVLSAIVLRLLAKNAIDRYQTIDSLKNDLKHCLRQWEESRQIPDFPLAQKDAWGTYTYTDELAGREYLLNELRELFSPLALSSHFLISIKGEKGMGKSAILEKIRQLPNGYGLSGQFDASGQGLAYSAWCDVLRQYCMKIAQLSPENQEQKIQALQKNMGGLELELIRLVPEFSELVSSAKPLPHAASESEGRNRSLLAWNRFFETLVEEEGIHGIFLDDLHWADESSISLMHSLLNNHALSGLVITISYRPSEMDDNHPYSRWLMQSAPAIPFFEQKTFNLNNLQPDDIRQMAEQSFKGVGDWNMLAELLWTMTQGKPSAVRSIMDAMIHEQGITWEKGSERWHLYPERILAIHNSTHPDTYGFNVLNHASEELHDLLKIASACGTRFSLKYLFLLTQRHSEDNHRILWPAIQKGLILPVIENYHYLPEYYAQNNIDVPFEFASDSLWENLYLTLDPDHIHNYAELLANYLLNEMASEGRANQSIELASYLTRCSQEFLQQRKNECYPYLKEAGNQSIASNAFDKAFVFLEAALRLIPEHEDAEERGKLAGQLIQTAFFSMPWEKFHDYYNKLISRFDDGWERLFVDKAMVSCLVNKARFKEAIELTEDILARLKAPIPKKGTLPVLIWELLQTPVKKLENVHFLPDLKDTKVRFMLGLMKDASPAYFFLETFKYAILSYRMIRLTFSHGLSEDGAVALSLSLLTTGLMKNPKKARHVFQSIKKEIHQRSLHRAEPVLGFVEVFSLEFRFRPWTEMAAMALKAYNTSVLQGDISFAGWNHFVHVTYLFYSGKPLSAIQEAAEKGYYTNRQFNQTAIAEKYRWILPIPMVLSGQAPLDSNWDMYDFKEEECLAHYQSPQGDKGNLIGWHQAKAYCHLLFGNYQTALDHLKKAEKHANTIDNTIYQIWQYQLITLCGAALPTKNPWILQRVKKLQKSAFAGSPDMLLVLSVYGLFQSKENISKAEDRLKTIMKKCEELENGHLQGFAALLFAEKIRSFSPELAISYYQKASHIWTKSGCTSIAEHAIKQALKYKTTTPLHKEGWQGSQSGEFDADKLDILSLLKSSEAILSEIRLEPLLDKLMHYALENAGAQQGYFIIDRSGQWQLELMASAGEKKTSDFIRSPLRESSLAANSIIEACAQSRKPIILRDATQHESFNQDPAIITHKTRSVLCLPLVHQSRITGFLYLVNNLMTNAFHEERVRIITLMTGQISMAIENALLYESMESQVAQRTEQLRQEKIKSDELLRNILPDEIAAELKLNGKAAAKKLEMVSVMFTDFVNFTGLSRDLSPEDLVADIDEYFSAFDAIMEEYQLEKIKTIGDAYMCACGLPVAREDHASRMIEAAFAILDYVEKASHKRKSEGKPWYEIRIGINSGPVIAGIVGTKKFAYDIWGETVNIASRLENNSDIGKINVSERTARLLDDTYILTERGKLPIKNLGSLEMYFVDKKPVA